MSRTTLYTIIETETGNKKGIYVNENSAQSRMADLNSWAIRRAFDEAINLRGPIRGQGRERYNQLVRQASKGFYHITTSQTQG